MIFNVEVIRRDGSVTVYNNLTEEFVDFLLMNLDTRNVEEFNVVYGKEGDVEDED